MIVIWFVRGWSTRPQSVLGKKPQSSSKLAFKKCAGKSMLKTMWKAFAENCQKGCKIWKGDRVIDCVSDSKLWVLWLFLCRHFVFFLFVCVSECVWLRCERYWDLTTSRRSSGQRVQATFGYSGFPYVSTLSFLVCLCVWVCMIAIWKVVGPQHL